MLKRYFFTLILLASISNNCFVNQINLIDPADVQGASETIAKHNNMARSLHKGIEYSYSALKAALVIYAIYFVCEKLANLEKNNAELAKRMACIERPKFDGAIDGYGDITKNKTDYLAFVKQSFKFLKSILSSSSNLSNSSKCVEIKHWDDQQLSEKFVESDKKFSELDKRTSGWRKIAVSFAPTVVTNFVPTLIDKFIFKDTNSVVKGLETFFYDSKVAAIYVNPKSVILNEFNNLKNQIGHNLDNTNDVNIYIAAANQYVELDMLAKLLQQIEQNRVIQEIYTESFVSTVQKAIDKISLLAAVLIAEGKFDKAHAIVKITNNSLLAINAALKDESDFDYLLAITALENDVKNLKASA